MSLWHIVTALPKSSDKDDAPETQLSGHWLFLARVVCFTAIALTLILFIASLPIYIAELQTICQTASCAHGQLTVETAHALENLGLTVSGYTILNVTLTITFALVWFAVSGLLLWRKSNDWMALLIATMLVMLGVYGGQGASGLNTVAGSHSVWQFPAQLLNYLSYLTFGLVLMLFPTGRFVPRWLRWLFVVAIVEFTSHDLLYDWPFTLSPWIFPLNYLLFFGCIFLLFASQVYRYRRVSSATQRLQTKWVVFSLTVNIVGSTITYLPVLIFPSLHLNQPSSLYSFVLIFLNTFMLLLVPLSIGIAILRYRLYDIDIIINRTLVYGSLTACIIIIYALTVGGLGTLLQARGNFFISLLSAGLIAVLFHPLREQLQRGINRLLYGQRDEPYAVISHLGRRLEATLAPERVLPTIVETTAQALKLPYVAILFQQGEAFTLAASYGELKDEAVSIPLIYQAEHVGELRLAPRSPGEAFTPSDRRLLEDLARQAGVAVYAVRLTKDLQQLASELQRSRTHLVTTREEERRRLRRDLHDGLGSVLTSLNFRAGAIRSLFVRNPAAAEALLEEQQAIIRSAIADIRRLVYDLRPPSLDELGLIGALCERVAHYNNPSGSLREPQPIEGLRVALEAPEDLPPLSAAIEVAVYRIVQEALANVVRHAQARTCCVQITIQEGTLQVEIIDDGKGLPAEFHMGVGMLSIRERAAELGGTCQVRSEPEGGTHVHVCLPLPSD